MEEYVVRKLFEVPLHQNPPPCLDSVVNSGRVLRATERLPLIFFLKLHSTQSGLEGEIIKLLRQVVGYQSHLLHVPHLYCETIFSYLQPPSPFSSSHLLPVLKTHHPPPHPHPSYHHNLLHPHPLHLLPFFPFPFVG